MRARERGYREMERKDRIELAFLGNLFDVRVFLKMWCVAFLYCIEDLAQRALAH